MKFEIPLTETQRYVLKTTAGFSGLPHSFSQVDLKKSKDDNREIPELELPVWKRKIQKRRRRYGCARDKSREHRIETL